MQVTTACTYAVTRFDGFEALEAEHFHASEWYIRRIWCVATGVTRYWRWSGIH
jgi:hypothetical protein